MKIFTQTYDLAKASPQRFWVAPHSQFAIGIKVLANGQDTGGTVSLSANGEALEAEQDKIDGFTIFNTESGNPGSVEYTVVDSTKTSQPLKLIQVVTDSTVFEVGGSGGGASITVDAALSADSENPVQNKVVTEALAAKRDKTDLAVYQRVFSCVNTDGVTVAKVYFAPQVGSLPERVIVYDSDGTTALTDVTMAQIRAGATGWTETSADNWQYVISWSGVAVGEVGIENAYETFCCYDNSASTPLKFNGYITSIGQSVTEYHTTAYNGTITDLGVIAGSDTLAKTSDLAALDEKRDIDDFSYINQVVPPAGSGYFIVVDSNGVKKTLTWNTDGGYQAWKDSTKSMVIESWNASTYAFSPDDGQYPPEPITFNSDGVATVTSTYYSETYTITGFIDDQICLKSEVTPIVQTAPLHVSYLPTVTGVGFFITVDSNRTVTKLNPLQDGCGGYIGWGCENGLRITTDNGEYKFYHTGCSVPSTVQFNSNNIATYTTDYDAYTIYAFSDDVSLVATRADVANRSSLTVVDETISPGTMVNLEDNHVYRFDASSYPGGCFYFVLPTVDSGCVANIMLTLLTGCNVSTVGWDGPGCIKIIGPTNWQTVSDFSTEVFQFKSTGAPNEWVVTKTAAVS